MMLLGVSILIFIIIVALIIYSYYRPATSAAFSSSCGCSGQGCPNCPCSGCNLPRRRCGCRGPPAGGCPFC